MPIGNLTSQIFANIYLNEHDRFVKHVIKPKAYLRYGDDFIIIDADRERLMDVRGKVQVFLRDQLKLDLHSQNDIILKTKDGLRFLGVFLTPRWMKLNKRNRKRVLDQLDLSNAGSYWGMMKQYENKEYLKMFQWGFLEQLQALETH